MQSTNEKTEWVNYAIMICISAIPLLLLGLYVFLRFNILSDHFFQFAWVHISEDDKEKIYALLAEQTPGLYDTSPEPLVGRLLKKNVIKRHNKVEIRSNNGGMRSKRFYGSKKKNTYRMICLGDSLVFGSGGEEEDRFGDQIEEMLREWDVRIDGKEVEVYSIGIESWTALEEATYLSSRISAYNPDLVLVLMVSNDISENLAVTGIGQPTQKFSSEARSFGSGVFVNSWPGIFGIKWYSVLSDDLGPESRALWEKAFTAWKRLETLLDRKGKKMILGILDQSPLFTELCKYFHERSGMHSPLIVTQYFESQLPNDIHPNREGHRILALHYLHKLASLRWLPVSRNDLPALEHRLTVSTERRSDAEKLDSLKRDSVMKTLTENMAFNDMNGNAIRSFLGGIYPGRIHEPLKHYPYGSPRSGFLLRRKEDAKTVMLEIEVPQRVELYPFKLDMYLTGHKAAELELDDVEKAGTHRLQGVIPETEEFEYAVEVVLRTDSYWTTIDDHTMKSYRLISAWQE
ncbi:MAG: SGNH/GDSL hydrolase family protein [Candidatus Abyssubacteria bacterium]|nr:SGNH/GDSL hydrolase family protein [Candidatus Abyssubacteria bacterium]